MQLIQGSTHTISLANLKDADGKAHALPAGMVPAFTVSPAEAATLGAQAADGSQAFTVSESFTGDMTITGSLAYPNGDVVVLTPAVATVLAAEDKTGDIVIN